MVSFLRLADQMRRDRLGIKSLFESDEIPSDGPRIDGDTPGTAAIRTGMNLRKKECGDFWEDFITVTGNADALSDLLDVPKETITGWPGRIRQALDRVRQSDDQTAGDSSRSEVISTGDKIAQPAEHPGADTPDTRPFPS